MIGFKLFVRGVLLLVASPLAIVSAAQEPCPDVRASQVDARTYWSGDIVRCGVGFRIFGIGGGLFGPRCGDRKIHVPAHQVCNGEANPGTKCLPAGTIELSFEECHCARATVLGTGLLFPSCECSPGAGNPGTVEDFMTVPCEPKIEDPGS